MRPFVVEFLNEVVELGLLLQDVGASWPGGFFLQRQVHAFMSAVLLRMAGLDAFDADAESQPPHRKLREIEQAVGRSERNTVVRADRTRQTALFEQPLKGRKGRLFRIGFHRLAQQQIARGVIGDGQRIAVAFIAKHELALVVGAPQIVRDQGPPKAACLRCGFSSAWDVSPGHDDPGPHGWCYRPGL